MLFVLSRIELKSLALNLYNQMEMREGLVHSKNIQVFDKI